MITIEGFYFTVTDLDKSIKFYEELLGISPTHVEGNRWADFYQGDKHFGLLCDAEINRAVQLATTAFSIFTPTTYSKIMSR